MKILAALALLSASFSLPTAAKPAFRELLDNPHWYRTYNANSSIIPSDGSLLFAWSFTDPEKQADSFFVGIDTLWGLPQDLNGDTSADWDLQVCPDQICMNGLKDGIHGANAPYPFGGDNFASEHHFQFFPAISKTYDFIAPEHSLFGALMYCRSRSTGISDTVLAFGSWNMVWDTASPPPVRPIEGYLPKRSDFDISGDTVRYLKAGSGILPGSGRSSPHQARMSLRPQAGGVRIAFPGLRASKEVGVYSWDGKRIWSSGELSADRTEITWRPAMRNSMSMNPGFFLIRLSWPGGEAWGKAPLLAP